MSKDEKRPLAEGSGRGGKYLTFGLDNEEYGFEILKVREIIGQLNTTAVPGMPDYMLGVVNLRGQVIPVIDLRLRFGMPQVPTTSESCIVVVDVGGAQTGVVVDRVSEVLDIHDEDIEDAPPISGRTGEECIRGIAKANGRVKILLKMDSVFASTTALADVRAA